MASDSASHASLSVCCTSSISFGVASYLPACAQAPFPTIPIHFYTQAYFSPCFCLHGHGCLSQNNPASW